MPEATHEQHQSRSGFTVASWHHNSPIASLSPQSFVLSPNPTVTFLICSHLAPPSLDATLQSIAAQEQLDQSETILINNGFPAVRAEQMLTQFPAMNLRIIGEPRPGLGFARRTGFAAAEGRFLVLLDDDNTIGPGFLSSLLDTISRDDTLGGVIPRIEPAWETQPPPWVVDVGMKCLSFNTTERYPLKYADGQYWPSGSATVSIRPPGGGMIIHRDVARHYLASIVDETRISLARQPTSLVGCEDEDVFRGVPELGFSVRCDQRLTVRHHIPNSRTRLKYLLRLNLQMSYSYGMLYGFVKPEARFSYRMEAGRLIRNGGAAIKDCMTKKVHVASSMVELSREIGWTVGRWKFTHRRMHA